MSADGSERKRTVKFAEDESPPAEPPERDKPPEAPPSIMYDPAGVSESYNIYTGASNETKTQRKSEDHVLAKARQEAAVKQTEAAAAAVAATSAFNQTVSVGRHERSRTAVAGMSGAIRPGHHLEVENSSNGMRVNNENCAENCANRCTANCVTM
mmetsp:Transcript_82936/g.146830  ORF Transcript_82936/g.146830 Transcript_82936/m.146830 type:complete len:155 (-) Transcript_82936:54-518(-)